MKRWMAALALAGLAAAGCGKKEAEVSLADRIADTPTAIETNWLLDYEDDKSGLGDILAAIRDKEPALYDTVVRMADSYMTVGDTPERSAILAVTNMAEDELMKKYIPQAYDEDLRDLLLVHLDTLQQMQKSDPALCASMEPGAPIPLDKEPVGVQNRRQASLARIVRQQDAALKLPTAEDRQAWADALNKNHPDVVELLQRQPDAGKAVGTPEELCHMVITLLDEMVRDHAGLAVFRSGLATTAQNQPQGTTP